MNPIPCGGKAEDTAPTNIIHRSFKYRLYPSKSQMMALDYQLFEARRLYNAALQERRDAWKLQKIGLNYYSQVNQLKEIRYAGNLDLANFSACQDVLRRADKAFKAFFRRVKAGGKAGYPRFKPRDRFNSFTFPAWGDGCHLANGRLKVQGIGIVKVKLHRPITGEIRTLTLKREADKWYAYFSLLVDSVTPSQKTNAIGLDVGLYSFAALSGGQLIANPRNLRRGAC